MIHILNTNPMLKLRALSLCGLRGKAIYDPTKSDCQDCLERFNQLYPGSYEAWVRKNKRAQEKTIKETDE